MRCLFPSFSVAVARTRRLYLYLVRPFFHTCIERHTHGTQSRFFTIFSFCLLLVLSFRLVESHGCIIHTTSLTSVFLTPGLFLLLSRDCVSLSLCCALPSPSFFLLVFLRSKAIYSPSSFLVRFAPLVSFFIFSSLRVIRHCGVAPSAGFVGLSVCRFVRCRFAVSVAWSLRVVPIAFFFNSVQASHACFSSV